MIVCSCNVLSDSQVRETCARADAPRSPFQVYQCLGCSPQCGRCARTIRSIMNEALGSACETCPVACPATQAVPAE
jgi:bacterioferritin-associated ferredoxin